MFLVTREHATVIADLFWVRFHPGLPLPPVEERTSFLRALQHQINAATLALPTERFGISASDMNAWRRGRPLAGRRGDLLGSLVRVALSLGLNTPALIRDWAQEELGWDRQDRNGQWYLVHESGSWSHDALKKRIRREKSKGDVRMSHYGIQADRLFLGLCPEQPQTTQDS